MAKPRPLLGILAIGLGAYLLLKKADGSNGGGDPNLNGKINFATSGISQSLILRTTIEAENTGNDTANFKVILHVNEILESGDTIPVGTHTILPILELSSGEKDVVGKEINLAPLQTSTGYFLVWELFANDQLVDTLERTVPLP